MSAAIRTNSSILTPGNVRTTESSAASALLAAIEQLRFA